jgi:retron-type reverse transcriptase
MVSYIEKQDLLYSSQYGFRKGHSTQHAILELLDDIQTNMNKKLFSCGVSIDLKKAFDTVDHNILLNKLNYYGFRGIVNDWFSSYLKNRTQTTQVGQHI